MSSEDEKQKQDKTDVIFEAEFEQSSEEPPMDEWSSLSIGSDINIKKHSFQEDVYLAGSGDICTKYVALSDSTVYRHPYYHYPAVLDPGNEKALLKPEISVSFSEDGQELYLATCTEMNQCPVRLFYTNLMESEINLSYYGVNPAGVRAMATALRFNRSVKVFNLTDNFLNNDACFHLGELVTSNSCLTELNLSGCRIGPEGLQRICSGLIVNPILKILNLDKNQLGDRGGEMIAKAITEGIFIEDLSLSNNNLGGATATAFTEAFQTNNNLVKLNLSWNNLFMVGPICNLLSRLGENRDLEMLNLSWNSLSGNRVGTAVMSLLQAPYLKHLDLSNNRLADDAITSIASGLRKAKKLVTLDLSFNPLTPADAIKLIEKMTFRAKLQRLILDDVLVNEKFMEIREKVLKTKTKKGKEVTFGNVISKCVAKGLDPKDLVLNRADFLLKKPKKNKVDIALVALQLVKDNVKNVPIKDFANIVGGNLDADLVNEIGEIFPGIKTAKAKTIDITHLVEYMRRKWPERQLPPTPPPTPPPEQVTKPKHIIKQAKADKKRKKK